MRNRNLQIFYFRMGLNQKKMMRIRKKMNYLYKIRNKKKFLKISCRLMMMKRLLIYYKVNQF